MKMIMPWPHFSQDHQKEAVAVFSNLGIHPNLAPNPLQNKKVDSLTSANLL
jgi:hypothetical protein